MGKQYQPELGQAIFGAPTGEFESPEFVEAFVDYILWRIDLVFWNREQRQWDKFEDPKIPGLEYRSYYWGDDESEMEKANMKWREVELRWYKYPGRGQTVNVDWTPNQWVEWFDSLTHHLGELQDGDMPDAAQRQSEEK